ncbi:MAG: DnaJ family domain-containing protein [Ectothiorhodospira sp.]
MELIDRLVESRVREAERDGVFDHLPGQGRPLELEDDRMVPEELRAAYRLLRNSGFIPEEVRLRREIREAEDLLRACEDETLRRQQAHRLRLLLDRLGRQRGVTPALASDYLDRIRQRMDGPDERDRPG